MEVTTYALYSNLLADVGFDAKPQKGPHQASTPKEAAKLSIAHSLLKKFEISDKKAESAALLKFLASNYRCKNWSLKLNTSVDELLWGEFKRSLYNFWFDGGEPIDCSDWAALSHGRTGPGAAVGAIGESFYAKMFSSKLSSTVSGLYTMYKSYISSFPSWREAEIFRRDACGELDIVAGSRLSFVPKTTDIARCICIEPSLNMFYQLGVGRILEYRIKQYFGIDLSDQQFRNRDMARIGSIYDSNVTIDLASASDSIGLNLCKEILPKSLWDVLHRYRCSTSILPGLGEYELDIVSSMGNGFTFPLQTTIFCAMVQASYRACEVAFPISFSQKEWGVFGDDIIVPKGKIERCLLRLLQLAGFEVNESKSFTMGHFRESCGSDYFDGVDVRGVYVRRLKTPQDIFVVINRLNLFSMRTGVILPKTVQYLLRFVPRVFVPVHENDDAGIKVPSTLIPLASSKIGYNENGSYVYQAYRPIIRKLRFSEDSIVVPRFLRGRGYFYNPLGALVAFIQRSLDACSISARLGSITYTRKTHITPNWDMCAASHPLSGWVPWQRFGSAVYLNIMF